MTFAAVATTNWLSETETSRLYFALREFSASTIDCVKARSFTALGATRATLSVTATGLGLEATEAAAAGLGLGATEAAAAGLGLGAAVGAGVLLPEHAPATRATTTAARPSERARSGCRCIMFLLDWNGCVCAAGRGWAEHSVASTLPLEWSPEDGRLAEPTSQEQEGEHGDDGRRGGSQVRRAQGDDPERLPGQDDHADQPVEQRPEHHADRAPRPEIDERDGDEPLALGQVDLEDPAVHEEARPGEARERAADEHGGPADPGHAHPNAVGRGRVLPHRPDLQPVGCPVEEEGHDRDEEEGQVHEQALVEEHATNERDRVEHRNPDWRQRRDRERRADELLEQQRAEPEAEEVDADPADALFGLERHADERGDHAHERAGGRSGQDREQQVARLQLDVVGGERPKEHDPCL